MKEQLIAYLVSRYGSICDEVQFCLDAMNHEHRTLEDAIAALDWAFWCEWDCDLDMWHIKVLGQEINE